MQAPPANRRRAVPSTAAVALTVCVCLSLTQALGGCATTSGPVAAITSVDAEGSLQRGDRSLPLQAGFALLSGDRIRLPMASSERGEGRVALEFGGGAQLVLAPDSELLFERDGVPRLVHGRCWWQRRSAGGVLRLIGIRELIAGSGLHAEMVAGRDFALLQVHQGSAERVGHGGRVQAVAAGERLLWTADGTMLSVSSRLHARADPPTGELVVWVEREGQVVIEAERFDENLPRDAAEWVVVEAAGASDGRCVVANAGRSSRDDDDYQSRRSELRYLIRFSMAASYRLWLRSSCPSGDSNSVYLGFDGRGLGRFDLDDNGRWEWNRDGSIEILVERPGVHSLHLWVRETGSRIDQIALSAQPGFEPPDRRPLPGTVRH